MDSSLPKIDKKPFSDRLPPVGNVKAKPTAHHPPKPPLIRKEPQLRKMAKKQVLPKLSNEMRNSPAPIRTKKKINQK